MLRNCIAFFKKALHRKALHVLSDPLFSPLRFTTILHLKTSHILLEKYYENLSFPLYCWVSTCHNDNAVAFFLVKIFNLRIFLLFLNIFFSVVHLQTLRILIAMLELGCTSPVKVMFIRCSTHCIMGNCLRYVLSKSACRQLLC